MPSSTIYCYCVLFVACLIQMPATTAFHKRHSSRSKFSTQKRSDESNRAGPNPTPRYIKFDEQRSSGPLVEAQQFDSVALKCEAVGSPPPTVHWLKNGVPVRQGDCGAKIGVFDYEGESKAIDGWLRISSTVSNLFIDCAEEDDIANYTCVAETPTHRETISTKLIVASVDIPPMDKVLKCASKGSPARIYMSSRSRLEYTDNDVQFACRAQGNPKPTITWYDGYNNTVQDGGQYKIMPNGDLIIQKITFEDNMGVYTCVASNKYGKDYADPFLYPTASSGGQGWPF